MTDAFQPGAEPDTAAADDGSGPAESEVATAESATAAEVESEAAQVEVDIDLAAMAKERDDYLDALRRLQADFENYKKRMVRQQTEHLERAAEALVLKLLPVFDTADLAIAHAAADGDGQTAFDAVQQVWTALFDTLGKEGLERIDPVSEPFDPNEHDAVMHEPGEGPAKVVDVMRAGYRWKGRVLRPAMVKVTGS